jgi:hypothetical protein
MSDGDDRDGGKMGAFLLGFLVGVLVCLGGGGAFVFVQGRQMHMRELAAMEEAMAARDEARAAQERARAEAERAAKLLHEAKEKGKDDKAK